MAQTCRHSKNVLLSKGNFFLFFTYKDISVVFPFVLKLLKTGQHLYFPLPQRVFWLAVSGWVPRNVGCVAAPMDSWCQGAEIRQLLQVHGWQPLQWQGWPVRNTMAGPGRFTAPWGHLHWLPWSGCANKNFPSPGWARKKLYQGTVPFSNVLLFPACVRTPSQLSSQAVTNSLLGLWRANRSPLPKKVTEFTFHIVLSSLEDSIDSISKITIAGPWRSTFASYFCVHEPQQMNWRDLSV